MRKYREGLGGRHLQGRFHNRDVEKRVQINDQVFGMTARKSDQSSSSSLAYLDLKVEDREETNRITIELASAALPNTCENFRKLLRNEEDASASSTESEQSYSYQNSKVFRIEPNVGICMGDVTEANNGLQGSCHPSIPTAEKSYGNSTTFSHESTVLSHAQKGMVSMLSSGLDKNDSRFMITTVDDAPHLDGKYVAFGRVKDGMDALEDLVQSIYTKKGKPTVDIHVVDCGVL